MKNRIIFTFAFVSYNSLKDIFGTYGMGFVFSENNCTDKIFAVKLGLNGNIFWTTVISLYRAGGIIQQTVASNFII